MAKRRDTDAEVLAKLKTLKAKGLYSGDLRRRKPTKYGRSLVQKLGNVLVGQAKVVKVPTKTAERSLKAQGFTVRKHRVIVPSPDKSVKIYVSKKNGNIVRKSKVNAEDIEAASLTGREEGGTYWLYTEHMHQEIGDKAAMQAFVNLYSRASDKKDIHGKKRRYKPWTDIEAYIFWEKGEDGRLAPLQSDTKKRRKKKKKGSRK